MLVKQAELGAFMPVLIVMLISLIAMGAMAWWVMQRLRSLEVQSTAEKDEGEAFSAVPISLAFEPDYAVIWDTQVPALNLISHAGAHGVALPRLYRCYLEQSRHYPELYEGSSFRTWVAFLEDAHLIVCDDDRMLLSREGRDFLDYRVSAEPLILRYKKRR